MRRYLGELVARCPRQNEDRKLLLHLARKKSLIGSFATRLVLLRLKFPPSASVVRHWFFTPFGGDGTRFANPLASSCPGVQSCGGNAIRQNSGEGFTNSIPTSCLSACRGPRYTTRESCCSPVLGFTSVTGSSANNFIASKTSAPCAFKTNVTVSSEIGFWLGLARTTETGTPTSTR
jgi:hypothetical protein